MVARVRGDTPAFALSVATQHRAAWHFCQQWRCGTAAAALLSCILTATSTAAAPTLLVSGLATATSGCARAVGADARCCNLTMADEYARFGMLGPVYANLDLAAYSMAIAAGIDCCSNNGAPCRACIQGLAPDDPVNKTMAGENTAEVNRLVRILSRWRCFGGDVAQAPSEFSQSLGAKTEDLRYIANGGCACSDCPPAKCSSEDDGWWLYYALPVGGVALIVAAGCLYRRRRAQLAPTSACSEGEIQRTLLV